MIIGFEGQRRMLMAIIVEAVVSIILATTAHASEASKQLFNGKDLDDWYVYTTETKDSNPGVFQVVDGMIYVVGGHGDVAYLGGLITKQAYENYRLRLEYKWGESTYGIRKGKARDSGVLLHCVGPDGPAPWPASYEYQIEEGATGDLWVVNYLNPPLNTPDKKISITCVTESELRDDQRYFKPGGAPFTFQDTGHQNWWGRDPGWKDELGFRGRQDLESPHGEWTKCEIVARGKELEFYVNGKLANRVTDLSVTCGKILLQTEGAEVWYRNIELEPLEIRAETK